MKQTLLALCLCLLHSSFSLATEMRTASEINKYLGRGINMGNVFEAPSETEWGNPWQPEYFRLMAEKGFTHVRVPIRWEPADRSMSQAPYTIYPVFLERIKAVVDEALENNLYIIINMHHHDALIANPFGQKERFLSQWKQIAGYFQNYSDSLLFEILNEPNGNLTPELWNTFAADALEEIRKTNPERTVLIGTAEWGGISGLSDLQLPDDDNIIVSLHYYNPFSFTHQGAEWSTPIAPVGIKWYDSEPERESIIREFDAVKKFMEKNNVPIHIGEFGAYNKADMDSRARWTTFLARWFEEQGFSWAYWEFSAGFGIYDPVSKTFYTPLVDALLYNPMPEPARIDYTTIYESDFRSGPDRWNFYTQSTCQGSLAVRNDKLEVNVMQAGTEAWHGQLIRNGISLEKNQTYRLSFTVTSTTPGTFTNYIGRNHDPWTAYGDYNSFMPETLEKTFSYTFTMTESDDSSARIVFDLGQFVSITTFSSIKLETMKITPTNISNPKTSNNTIRIYPNPIQNELFINNNEEYNQLYLYSISGNQLERHNLHAGNNYIQAASWKSGIYILLLKGEKNTLPVRVMKL